MKKSIFLIFFCFINNLYCDEAIINASEEWQKYPQKIQDAVEPHLEKREIQLNLAVYNSLYLSAYNSKIEKDKYNEMMHKTKIKSKEKWKKTNQNK
jgi:hypothetical protein